MSVFKCKAVDASGKVNEFLREAPSEAILIRELHSENLYPVSIEDATDKAVASGNRLTLPRKQLVEFTDTLSLLLTSGLELKDALDVSQTMFRKGKINALIVHLLESVKKGNTLHGAMEKAGSVFPPIYKGVVKLGERIGSLGRALSRISDYLHEEKKVKDKLLSSLMYPALVAFLAVVAVIFIGIFVLPRMEELFSSLSDMAGVDTIMSSIKTFATLGFTVCAVLVAAIVTIAIVRKTEGKAREVVDSFFLVVPGLRRYLLTNEMLNFTFAMETLTEGGVAVEDAIEESVSVFTNTTFKRIIKLIKQDVEKGLDLSLAFFKYPIFPERIGRWIGIGERSGQTELVFKQLRVFYQGEMETWITRFMNLVEPVLIILVGIFMIFIILTFIVPLLTMYGDFL